MQQVNLASIFTAKSAQLHDWVKSLDSNCIESEQITMLDAGFLTPASPQ
jgi:hypothetical protein